MSTSYDLNTDLNEVTTMVTMLEHYVRGPELYGFTSRSSSANMPSLTVGAVLLRLRRLVQLRTTMEDSQTQQLDRVIYRWQGIRSEWRLHYEEKLKRELESRLDDLNTFIKECSDSIGSCRDNYRPEMQRRTIIQEIVHELNRLEVEFDDTRRKLAETDARLRTYLRDSVFQWADDLQAVYPREEFWWLYQLPLEDENSAV